MAVLYSRIFVAIRRRSKLEIWQNAVVLAGGGRTRSSETEGAGTSRRLLDNSHDDGDESDGEELASSCSHGSTGDDGESATGNRLGLNAASQQPPSIVVELATSQKQPSSHSDEHGARSTRLQTDEIETLQPPTFEDESSLSHVVEHRKCVRFLIVKQNESDSNDVDHDQIEMWSVEQGHCEIANNQCSDDRGLPSRLMHRFRHRSRTYRPSRYRRRRGQKQNSLSSEVKAAKQLGVIMGAFCICFLPYFVCFVVVAFCHQCVSDRLMTTVTWIGYVNSTLNPFLYPLCNQQFRISFRRMFATILRLRTSESSVAPS